MICNLKQLPGCLFMLHQGKYQQGLGFFLLDSDWFIFLQHQDLDYDLLGNWAEPPLFHEKKVSLKVRLQFNQQTGELNSCDLINKKMYVKIEIVPWIKTVCALEICEDLVQWVVWPLKGNRYIFATHNYNMYYIVHRYKYIKSIWTL